MSTMFLPAYYHGIAVASAFYGRPRAGGTGVAAATDLAAALRPTASMAAAP